MSIPQKKMREAVFYVIFCREFEKNSDWEEIIPMLMEQLEMSKKNVKEAIYRACLVLEKQQVIDEKLKSQIRDYEFDRISCAEKNILRLATYELLFDNEIPEVVAISEGIRLCRKFSTQEGANFVNGVLDGLYKNQTHLITQ